jgi:hypothetical protein
MIMMIDRSGVMLLSIDVGCKHWEIDYRKHALSIVHTIHTVHCT